ncbi:unnamed protein product [Wickerhamomyces anomalus]
MVKYIREGGQLVQRLVHRVNSTKRSRIVLISFISVLCLVILQLNYLYLYKPSKEFQVSYNKAKPDGSTYYETSDLTVIKAHPEKPETQNITDGHVINDYGDDEYYKNKDFSDYTNIEKIEAGLNKYGEFKDFINNQLIQKILDTKPSFGPINNRDHYNKSNSYQTNWDGKLPVLSGKLRENNGVDPIRSKDYLKSFFLLKENEFVNLKNSHKVFLENMPTEFPENIAKNFKGNGILYAGGGNYNWLVLLSIKMLRDLGSKLPIEVFIPNENEYSVDLCDRIFPVFGAKCILMSNYIDTKKIKIKGYQLKSMALLLTSFENVLMLDSDNLPLKNPDLLFINEPFISKPLVIWPDFWRRSTSPAFYEIADIPINETNQVRFSYGDERDHPDGLKTLEDYNAKVSYHDLEGAFPEASSETGQVFINKKIHAKTLFLSLYYNYWGPNYYYPLFAQGQAGEGDKETLLASAHKFGLPYYQVQEYIREYGEIYENGNIEIAAMGQYDPILDYMQTRNPKTFNSKFPYDRTKDNYHMHRFKNSETLFLHCNQPKLYPWRIDGKGFRQIHDGDGNRRRLYSKLLIKELGYDFEAKIWETMKWILCEHGDMTIKGVRHPETWCLKVSQQLEFLQGDQL